MIALAVLHLPPPVAPFDRAVTLKCENKGSMSVGIRVEEDGSSSAFLVAWERFNASKALARGKPVSHETTLYASVYHDFDANGTPRAFSSSAYVPGRKPSTSGLRFLGVETRPPKNQTWNQIGGLPYVPWAARGWPKQPMDLDLSLIGSAHGQKPGLACYRLLWRYLGQAAISWDGKSVSAHVMWTHGHTFWLDEFGLPYHVRSPMGNLYVRKP